MLRKFWFVAALMVLPAAAANAQFAPGDWELTLSGEGRHGPDLNGTDFGVNFSLGYFLTKELELGVRQSVNYADDTGPGAALGTAPPASALDYHFDLGRWQPYIGANIGFRYGDVHNTFEAGPRSRREVLRQRHHLRSARRPVRVLLRQEQQRQRRFLRRAVRLCPGNRLQVALSRSI